jgi:hypothetical protein
MCPETVPNRLMIVTSAVHPDTHCWAGPSQLVR